jgi:hypothetical protein
MKLGEALSLRAAMQTKMSDLQNRITSCAIVQEDEEPPEDPIPLIAEYDRIGLELAQLVARINKTNSVHGMSFKYEPFSPFNLTITELLSLRDMARVMSAGFKSLAHTASTTGNRYSRSEIKSVNTLPGPDLRARADEYAKLLHDTDIALQQANWTVDLVNQ